MDDVVHVRFRKRISDLRGEGNRFFQCQRLSLKSQIKRLSLNVLHCDEAAAICFPDFINRANVRMIECRRCTRFFNQPLVGPLVSNQFRRQKLDSHTSAKLRILGEIHFTHPARANF